MPRGARGLSISRREAGWRRAGGASRGAGAQEGWRVDRSSERVVVEVGYMKRATWSLAARVAVAPGAGMPATYLDSPREVCRRGIPLARARSAAPRATLGRLSPAGEGGVGRRGEG